MGHLVGRMDSSGGSLQEEGEIRSREGEKAPPKFTPIVFDIGSEQAQPPQAQPQAPKLLSSSLGPATKYFIARCNYYDMFVKSKRDRIWRAPSYIIKRVEEALPKCERVWLLFSVHGSQYFQGIAEVSRAKPIEYPNATNDRLARAPLEWVIMYDGLAVPAGLPDFCCSADVPYGALPHVPGLVNENGLRESFEVPEEHGKQFLAVFEKCRSLDPPVP